MLKEHSFKDASQMRKSFTLKYRMDSITGKKTDVVLCMNIPLGQSQCLLFLQDVHIANQEDDLQAIKGGSMPVFCLDMW